MTIAAPDHAAKEQVISDFRVLEIELAFDHREAKEASGVLDSSVLNSLLGTALRDHSSIAHVGMGRIQNDLYTPHLSESNVGRAISVYRVVIPVREPDSHNDAIFRHREFTVLLDAESGAFIKGLSVETHQPQLMQLGNSRSNVEQMSRVGPERWGKANPAPDAVSLVDAINSRALLMGYVAIADVVVIDRVSWQYGPDAAADVWSIDCRGVPPIKRVEGVPASALDHWRFVIDATDSSLKVITNKP